MTVKQVLIVDFCLLHVYTDTDNRDILLTTHSQETTAEVMGKNLKSFLFSSPWICQQCSDCSVSMLGSLGMMSYGQHSVMITTVKASSLLEGFHIEPTCNVVQTDTIMLVWKFHEVKTRAVSNLKVEYNGI